MRTSSSCLLLFTPRKACHARQAATLTTRALGAFLMFGKERFAETLSLSPCRLLTPFRLQRPCRPAAPVHFPVICLPLLRKVFQVRLFPLRLLKALFPPPLHSPYLERRLLPRVAMPKMSQVQLARCLPFLRRQLLSRMVCHLRPRFPVRPWSCCNSGLTGRLLRASLRQARVLCARLYFRLCRLLPFMHRHPRCLHSPLPLRLPLPRPREGT